MASDQVDLIADGREALNRTVYSLEEFSHVYKYMVDGQYTPLDCTAIQKVPIIVPYRDREKQLRIFMNNVIPRIYRQQLEFGIYIIEQETFEDVNFVTRSRKSKNERHLNSQKET